ncbi:hypothetical protein AVEN_81763-1 [Araneus ventricosus]|uniref:Uncharacterized protein n=1 Tax=Araneus ventricosus TaxID=182803 RepID=A0A4Y2QY43_ARAVE|nr:hypothetical protein AVEN_81763-1 [Araneus ventricosus]
MIYRAAGPHTQWIFSTIGFRTWSHSVPRPRPHLPATAARLLRQKSVNMEAKIERLLLLPLYVLSHAPQPELSGDGGSSEPAATPRQLQHPIAQQPALLWVVRLRGGGSVRLRLSRLRLPVRGAEDLPGSGRPLRRSRAHHQTRFSAGIPLPGEVGHRDREPILLLPAPEEPHAGRGLTRRTLPGRHREFTDEKPPYKQAGSRFPGGYSNGGVALRAHLP